MTTGYVMCEYTSPCDWVVGFDRTAQPATSTAQQSSKNNIEEEGTVFLRDFWTELPSDTAYSLMTSACVLAYGKVTYRHMFRHPRCVFINYNWINQLSNTAIWWLDICCLLHRYQLHVSALMAIFNLID